MESVVSPTTESWKLDLVMKKEWRKDRHTDPGTEMLGLRWLFALME